MQELTQQEINFLSQIIRDRFDQDKGIDDAEKCINLCNKLGFDTIEMINDLETFKQNFNLNL